MDPIIEPLVIERPVAGGRMLARHDRRIVLVSGAIPGERVRVRIERMARQVIWADAVEILEPSADRRSPACDPSCGGALYAHVRYERQLELKSEVIADAFRRVGKIALPARVSVAASPETGYRLRARLHVSQGKAGFYREGTHVVCDAAATGQLHEDAMPAVESLTAALGDQLAGLEGIVVAENIAADERVLHLIPRAGQRVEGLRVSLTDLLQVTGVTADGERPHLIAGKGTVSDSADRVFGGHSPLAAPATWTRQAASFFQANRFLLGGLIARVVSAADGERCVDLYAGVGLFALALAASGKKVIAVEQDATSSYDLQQNAGPFTGRLKPIRDSVERFLRHPALSAPDVVVLDPPRTGASEEVLKGLAQWGPRRLVYVSCDPPTLARDAGRLIASGYELTSVDGFDLFPNTPHVEMAAVFER